MQARSAVVDPFDPLPVVTDRPAVLVVEDDPCTRESVVELLAAPGRVVRACGTGAEALELVKSTRFSLALLDIYLPDLTGIELLHRIRALGLDLAVVVVSGADSIDSAISAMRLGVIEYLRKPYDPVRLVDVVDKALDASRLRREHRLLRQRLEHSERLHRYLVERSPDLIYMLDEEGRFRFVNDRFEQLLGHARGDLVGRPFRTLVPEEDAERAQWVLNERRTGSRAAKNVELRFLRAHDGEPVTVVVSATGMYSGDAAAADGEPRFLGTYGVARDISDRKRAEAALAHHAFHDALTGLPNRTLFRDRLSLAIAQARRNDEKVAVLFIDLDRFKLINDSHGHVAGDQLLQHLARRLTQCLRAVDTVSRLGGDEFTAVVPGVRSAADAEVIARKVLQVVAEPIVLGDLELGVSCSVGVALFPDHGLSEDELLRHADLAMYRVKRSGKNGIAFFAPSMSAHGRTIELENDLRRAVRRDELEVHFQPVLDVGSRVVESVEALVRWRHPRAGLLGPARFIHLAEETGLMSEITGAVMRQSLARLREWRALGLPDLRVAVNVSAREFQGERFVGDVQRALDASGLPAAALELEITENVLIEDLDAAVEQVDALRGLGIRVSIDDFGTRYSSLGYLHRLPVNTIKIDQSFVHGLTGDRTSGPIVSAIVAIARGFGFDLVAEGVEDERHVRALQSLGCTKMQGFHFHRPESAERLSPYLLAAGVPRAAAKVPVGARRRRRP